MPGLFQQGQCDVMYTNTQTVATLKGKGIDVEFVKPESGAIARPSRPTPTSISTLWSARKCRRR